jgi:GrpB-like predicted nucleotidyltransferase (UPF0157 family)
LGDQLHGYDPRWPRIFTAEQGRIRATLGSTAIAIEHVGSSSSPGLSGRPEIDIIVGVSSSSDVDASARLLKGLGYVPPQRRGTRRRAVERAGQTSADPV